MKRTQKSQKRTKFLLLLIVLTAILSITATYAWFSTQKDVEITGMRLNVEVAESMQISLDGKVWTNAIQMYSMKQLYGTYSAAGETIYDAATIAEKGNANYVPTELKPVSSAGAVAAGKLQLVTGNLSGTKLKDIALCTETDLVDDSDIAARQGNNEKHPYLVFDMYVRNISARTTGTDPLLLNAGSNVWVNAGTSDDTEQEGKGVAGTGLEYSARVGMIVYGNTISTTATSADATNPIDLQIRKLAAVGDEKAAIWEPNDKEHIPYVVANNKAGITTTTQAVATKAIAAAAAGSEIADLNAANANIVDVNTFKPAYTLGTGTNAKTAITDVDGNTVGLKPNQISKVRVYVWLEGQDPDCVDLASTGDKLNINLKFIKDPYTDGVGGNTYVD